MVDVTPRLEEYVEADVAACCPTLDGTVESLEELETSVGRRDFGAELDLLAAVADETRYRILRILLESDERCVCELDALLDVSDSAISHAVGRLVDAGLVSRRKEGRWRIYAATDRAEALVAAVEDAASSTEADT
jgi:DNA-binding transcriptional ArsR family regulator